MVRKSKNLKKSQKSLIFTKKKLKKNNDLQKKSYPLSFPILGGRDSTRALQSSPFQISGGVVQA